MKKYHFTTHHQKMLADTHTPVSIYLKIRDRFPNSLLLESSDYHANDNSFSYICFNPIAYISIQDNVCTTQFPDATLQTTYVENERVLPTVAQFFDAFSSAENEFKFLNNGFFGYTSYDALRYFSGIQFQEKPDDLHIPELYYAVYQNSIAIDHFKNEAYLFCHSLSDAHNLEFILTILQQQQLASFSFETTSDAISATSDADFLAQIDVAKEHCARGNVFQMVLSRRFSQAFEGDDFNVYRSLRAVNPSPYLFYFDYGNFKILGSSPEAQLVINRNKAEIHPIAGTFKRTGNDEQDALLAKELSENPKENAEHVMLVDLARNDLSIFGNQVTVEKYQEVQFFSHVIHLVSKVSAQLKETTNVLDVFAATFPAGTLSGAPKHKALQLIDQIEPIKRSFYGGAIGCIDFKGNYNHAIMIRTLLSKNHQLHYQAGAGVVSQSSNENELQEVYNKLGALQQAIQLAHKI